MARVENQEPSRTLVYPPLPMMSFVEVKIIAGYYLQWLLLFLSLVLARHTLMHLHTCVHKYMQHRQSCIPGQSRVELFARAVRVSPGRWRRQPGSQGVSHAVHAPSLCGTDPTRLTASSFTMVSSFLMGTSGSMFTTTSPVG